MLRSRRAKLLAKPAATGLATTKKTMGIVELARLAATTAFVPPATIRSTLSLTSSSAIASMRLLSPSALHHTMLRRALGSPSASISCTRTSYASRASEAFQGSSIPMIRGAY